jgi:hypothetical protein
MRLFAAEVMPEFAKAAKPARQPEPSVQGR